MSAEPELNILLQVDTEAIRWRRRAMFLASVLFHGLLILFLIVEPQIFRQGARLMGIVAEPKRQENTFLVMPPDLLKQKKPPKTSILSDKNRHAQGPSPVVKPHGLTMPYQRGNTHMPEIAGGKPKLPPVPPKVASPPPAPPQVAKAAPPPPPAQKDQLKLLDVPRPSQNPKSAQLRLPLTTPGDAIQQSLAAAARGRATGAVQGPGDAPDQLNNLNPNFSTEGPTILSDTRGVDFGPYLARVVYVVRQNWYAVIPESARLGEKGRVGIIFEIVKDGSVPQIRLVASSGSGALDRAALASIRASNPFPPLPRQFTGQHLVLQFVFLYNMGYGYRY